MASNVPILPRNPFRQKQPELCFESHIFQVLEQARNDPPKPIPDSLGAQPKVRRLTEICALTEPNPAECREQPPAAIPCRSTMATWEVIARNQEDAGQKKDGVSRLAHPWTRDRSFQI